MKLGLVHEDPDLLIARVGRRIRELRKRSGLSQRRVAAMLRTKVSNYQRIEAGRQNVTLRTIALIAAALGTTASDLLEPPDDDRGREIHEDGKLRAQAARPHA